MAKIIFKAYHSDGSVRGIWTDRTGEEFRNKGVLPQRASRVEVITSGPRRADFHVDFSLLAEATNNASLAVCLVKTFKSYTAAVAAEVAWLEQNWMLSHESTH